ncbi:MAG: cytochrome c [Gemmatimonadetes bacterium]|nr:cytochrome c [Gemmatimonadota bacterium]
MRQAISLLALALAALVLTSCSPRASSPAMADAAAASKVDRAELGAELYRGYCVNCHGDVGRGDGPLAAILKVPTPDLTRIAARNDGVYPAETVTRQINGMEYLLPHGTGLMPVWGVVLNPDFQQGGDHNGAEVARRQIEALVEHVGSLQE